MSKAIRTLLAVDAGLEPNDVLPLLSGDDGFRVVGVVEGLDQAMRDVEDTPHDVVLVACAGYADRALVFVDKAVKHNRERPVVVLGHGTPNGFVRRVFEVGGEDIIMLPQSPEQVRFAIGKAIARHGGLSSGTSELGRMIVVLGPKGGTGKTLTASNLAVALQLGGHASALVDLDLQFGDVGLCIGLPPEKTIYDLALAGGTLDTDMLDPYLTTHTTGVRALLAPSRPDQASAVTTTCCRTSTAPSGASSTWIDRRHAHPASRPR